MRIKKLLAVAMTATLAMTALAGCGGSKQTEESKPAAESTQAAGDASTLKTVTEGKLTMATNAQFPPYEYYDGSEIVGIDAEIAKAVADKLGLELVISDMEFDSIITSVQTGKADLGLAGMTVTEERKQTVNFSESYATGIQSIVVAEDSTIAGPDDLKGKKIGVQLSTTGDIYATGDYGAENVEKFNKGADAIQNLKTGRVDAVIIDNEPAKSFVAANKGLKIVDTEYVSEDYAACIAKDNEALLTEVNAALAELKADGTLQSIVDKYIPAEK